MIPHLKHYAHDPNYEATHAIASRGFALRRFRVGPSGATAEETHHPPLVRFPTAKRSYISVVSLEVVTP